MHVSNLFFNRADGRARRAPGGALARRPRVLRQLRRRGQRGGAQARPQGAPARRDRRAPRRLPRPHLRRAVGDAPGVQAGAVRAARARLRAGRRATPAALDAAVHEGTAAVLLEPIQGETGVNVLPDELLAAARAACDRSGAALVFDEIQTGMGRTGTLWAYEATGVVPDAITVAKALGGGLPIGALITGERLRRRARARRPRLDVRRRPGRSPPPRTPRSTCSTTPRCSRACASSASGCASRLRELPGVLAVRGRGLMVAADVDRRRAGRRAPRPARAAAGDQRHRPGDAALPAAARDRPRPTSTTPSRGLAARCFPEGRLGGVRWISEPRAPSSESTHARPAGRGRRGRRPLVEEGWPSSGAPFDLDRAATLAEAPAPGRAARLRAARPRPARRPGHRRAARAAARWRPAPPSACSPAVDDEHRGVEAVAEGAQDYLVKGQVDGVLLVRALRYAVERKRADENTQRLREAQLEARESARLERGLLPAAADGRPDVTSRPFYRPGRRRACSAATSSTSSRSADGPPHVIVGDVCGHGPDEAALGVELRVAWRALVLAGVPGRAAPAPRAGADERAPRAPEIFATLCMVSTRPARTAPSCGSPATRRRYCSPAATSRRSSPARPACRSACSRTPRAGLRDRARRGLVAAAVHRRPDRREGRRRAAPARRARAGRGRRRGARGRDRPARSGPARRERAEDLNEGPLGDDVAMLLMTRRLPRTSAGSELRTGSRWSSGSCSRWRRSRSASASTASTT